MVETDGLLDDVSSKSAYFVQSLDRGLAVIRAFGSGRNHMSVTEVSDMTGVTRAAARRFLLTLVDLGYVRPVGREFALTPRVLELGASFLSQLSVPGLLEDHLTQLVEVIDTSTDVTVFDAGIAVLDAPDIVYVAQAQYSGLVKLNLSAGARFPAYLTSMGRVMLAHLGDDELAEYLRTVEFVGKAGPTRRSVTSASALRAAIEVVREQGWAVVDGEYEDWLRAYAVPLRDRTGFVAASVSIATHADGRSALDAAGQLIPMLQSAASVIEGDMRFLPDSSIRNLRPSVG